MGSTPREDLIERLKNVEYRKAFGAEQAKLEIASVLYKARKSANLTQKELSEKLKISQPYIAKLEAGEANPTVGIIGGILGMLGFRCIADIEPIAPKSSVDTSTLADILNFVSTDTITSTELQSSVEANAAWYPSLFSEEKNIPDCVVAGGL